MASTDKGGYIKQAAAGVLGLLMAPSAALAERKFLSLIPIPSKNQWQICDTVHIFYPQLMLWCISALRIVANNIERFFG